MKIKNMGRVVTGKTPPTDVKEYYGGNIMFISPVDLHGDYLITKSEKAITEEGLSVIEANSIAGTSILVGCIGWDMGNVAMCNSRCATNQQINSITDFNELLVDARYVYYWLKGKKDYLFSISSVTRTPILSKSVFEEIDIPMPPIREQVKVANLLALLDEKIRKNRMINDYLEEMAKTIYDYWFVQFDFPDENGNPYKSSGGKMQYSSELGMEIPEAWTINTLKAIHTIERGISYTSKDIREGKGIPMINLACIDINRNYRDGQLKFYNNSISADKYLSGDELLIACTDLTRNADIVGSPILVPKIANQMTFSMDMAKLEVDNHVFDKYYLYMALRTEYYHNFIKKYASGTNVLHLNLDGLNWYKMWIPPISLQRKFGNVIKNIQMNLNGILHENRQLQNLRDWLLPMLMNGQATIED